MKAYVTPEIEMVEFATEEITGGTPGATGSVPPVQEEE